MIGRGAGLPRGVTAAAVVAVVLLGAAWLVGVRPGPPVPSAARTEVAGPAGSPVVAAGSPVVAAWSASGVAGGGTSGSGTSGSGPCADAGLSSADRWAREVYRDLLGRLSIGVWPGTVYLPRRTPSELGPGLLATEAQDSAELDPPLYACLAGSPSGLGLDRLGVRRVVQVATWDDPAIGFTGPPGPNRTIPDGRVLVLSALRLGGPAGAGAATGSVTLTDGGQDSQGVSATLAPDSGGRPEAVGDVLYWIS